MSLRFWEDKILCALCISDNCPGLLSKEDLYQDKEGSLWDVCKPCKELENEIEVHQKDL